MQAPIMQPQFTIQLTMIIMTHCKIEFTYAPHCVSKNLTPRRMLKTSFLTAQIIGWNNSFRNMFDMLWQSGPFGGENLFCPRKKTQMPKIMDNFSDRLTLEGAGGQTGDTRSIFKPP